MVTDKPPGPLPVERIPLTREGIDVVHEVKHVGVIDGLVLIQIEQEKKIWQREGGFQM